MIWFYKASTCERLHPYVNAVVSTDTHKYTFGSVDDGEFIPGGTGTYYILQVEKGNDAFIETESVTAGSEARLVDVLRLKDQLIGVDYSSDDLEVGSILAPDENGELVITSNPDDFYLEVVDVIAYGVLTIVRGSNMSDASSPLVGLGRVGYMQVG